MTNNDLISLLREAEGWMARHVFGPESPACLLCGGESGFDVGRACPQAPDYDLRQRILTALAEPVETVALRDENLALRAALRAGGNNEDWRVKYLASELERVRLQERCADLRALADKAAHEQGLAQRRMLEAQEVTCKNCGERKPRSKICGHCAEDL